MTAPTVQLKQRYDLDHLITTGGVYSVFQPIVDLRLGIPVAYEVLSRVTKGGTSPLPLFEQAKEENKLWDLERMCREIAIRTIASFGTRFDDIRFFLNVSPYVLSDARFQPGYTKLALQGANIHPDRIVFEITEREAISDHESFAQLLHHYKRQGFAIALDDFGSGDSGLMTLVTCVPDYLKLDMALVRDVHLNPYKQSLVRSLVGFANNVDAKLIAEGVEQLEELESLVRLGVRFAQGYYFARPDREPPLLGDELRSSITKLVSQKALVEDSAEEALSGMVNAAVVIEEGAANCETVDRTFREEGDRDHLVIVRERHPVGLITRISFNEKTSGPVGYHLFRNRPAELMIKDNALVVREETSITALAQLAMERGRDEVYDPVIVVDVQGRLIGTVTMRQLISRATDLELAHARGASPLTNLPGNRTIEGWIRSALRSAPFTVVYGDLSRFKEFNDAYGFVAGDEMIRLAAKAMAAPRSNGLAEYELGHIGGDDFVIVSRSQIHADALEMICNEFDELRTTLFAACDIESGSYQSVDRQGNNVSVPLVSLGLAALTSDLVGADIHPAQLGRAASSLKKKVKQLNESYGTSQYMYERRLQLPNLVGQLVEMRQMNRRTGRLVDQVGGFEVV